MSCDEVEGAADFQVAEMYFLQTSAFEFSPDSKGGE